MIRIDPVTNRTYHYWHVFVPGVQAGQIYGYRVAGPFDPANGLRFDPTKVLLDPYGRGVVVPRGYSREAGRAAGRQRRHRDEERRASIRAATTGRATRRCDDPSSRDHHLRDARARLHPPSQLRRGASRRVARIAGLIEKIPYLQELGITAVELLPVFQFDAQDCSAGPGQLLGLRAGLLLRAAPGVQLAAGSARPGRRVSRHGQGAAPRRHRGHPRRRVQPHRRRRSPTGRRSAFAASTTATYYILEADRARYANYSGSGNTLNANHPIVRRMILDSLRYWVEEMHVDGFRFDLASILARDAVGRPAAEPAGAVGHRVGPGARRHEAHRRGVGCRRPVPGRQLRRRHAGRNGTAASATTSAASSAATSGSVAPLSPTACSAARTSTATRSARPEQSVNFVTCHDGFTLNDLVSYNRKHNEANGEDNRDGADDNRSWNCGVEGPTRRSRRSRRCATGR